MTERGPADIEFGALNTISKPRIGEPRYDPHTSNFYELNKRRQEKHFTPNCLKNRGSYRAVVLRVLELASGTPEASSWFSLEAVKRLFGSSAPGLQLLRIRIPEIHAACPMPEKFSEGDESGPWQGKINNYYPIVVAESESTPRAHVGDIVNVDFQDRINLTDGIYLGPVIDRGDPADPGSRNDFDNNSSSDCKDFTVNKTPIGGGFTILSKGKLLDKETNPTGGDETGLDKRDATRMKIKSFRCSWELYSSPAKNPGTPGFVFHDTGGWTWKNLVINSARCYWNKCKDVEQKEDGKYSHSGVTFSISVEEPAVIRRHHSLKRKSGHAKGASWAHGVEVISRGTKTDMFPGQPKRPPTPEDREYWEKRHGRRPLPSELQEDLVAPFRAGKKRRAPSKSQMEAGYQLILWLSKLPPSKGGGLQLKWHCVTQASKKEGSTVQTHYPFGTMVSFYNKCREGVWAHHHNYAGHDDGYLICLYCYYRHYGASKKQAYEWMKWTVAKSTTAGGGRGPLHKGSKGYGKSFVRIGTPKLESEPDEPGSGGQRPTP